jgi:hypothetical protein
MRTIAQIGASRRVWLSQLNLQLRPVAELKRVAFGLRRPKKETARDNNSLLEIRSQVKLAP